MTAKLTDDEVRIAAGLLYPAPKGLQIDFDENAKVDTVSRGYWTQAWLYVPVDTDEEKTRLAQLLGVSELPERET